MSPEIKFCGMTRTEDVGAAIALGADYVGVIFAGGPRLVSVDRARELLSIVPGGTRRVGVFGPAPADVIGEVSRSVRLDVVQLHGDPDAVAVTNARAAHRGEVWAAVRIRGDVVPAQAGELFAAADAVVLDAYSAGSLGGTGVALSWGTLADALSALRRPAKLVLAGGLRAENVAAAIRTLRPDVVDVSSGVESAAGVKDHAKLRAFQAAVRGEGSGP